MFAQIVFLIDTNVQEVSDIQKTRFCNSICLTCLRLLHLYSAETDKRGVVNKSKQVHTSVKWGYKFFCSKALRTKIESHKLFDFKLKYFEEFENELHRRFEKTSSNVKAKCKPSDCLSKTFTEVLSDFQWENPDITSPIKGRKHRKNISTHSNVVILFTPCPKNGVELKKFTGKQVPDEDVFLDSVLPPTLFQEFCHVNKLTLNWIDTSIPSSVVSNNAGVSSASIIDSAIAKAGGKVFPLGAVAQSGSPYFSHLSDLLKELAPAEKQASATGSRTDDGASILPLSSTLGSVFSPSWSSRQYAQSDGKHVETCISIGCQEIRVTLDPSSVKSRLERSCVKGSDNVDLSRVLLKGEYGTGISSTPAITHLQAYGVMAKHSVTMVTGMHSCYICAESLQAGEDKKAIPGRGLFQSLLTALATRQSVMVLLCKNTGDLAVLEPFTAQTASLSLLTQGSSLCMEKALLTQEMNRIIPHVKSESCDDLVQRLLSSRHIPKAKVECEEPRATSFDGKLMDRWYLPGPGSSLKRLVGKLNDRIGDLPFLSTDEVSVLKQLQKCYKQEGRPPGQRETPAMPLLAAPDTPKPEVDKLELPYKGKASRVSLSRVDMIMHKSKEVSKERGQTEREDAGGAQRERPDRDKLDIAAQLADFQTEEELKDYLTFTYRRLVSREIFSVDSTIQTMVTVTLHYLKQQKQKEPEAKCQSFLEDCLVISGAKLRDKYNTAGDSASLEQKIAEYQAQVLLRLEVLSNLVNKDQSIGEEEANEEIVGLLRTLSFIWDPGALSQFMQSSLTYNYMHTIPRTLANIYDELMQPLPDVLANLLSPDDDSADKSGLNDTSFNSTDEFGPPSARTRSHLGSVGPPSSQPASNASMILDTSLVRTRPGRKLVHHPSMSDYGSKRQIVIQKASKPKEAKSGKRKRQDSGKDHRDGVSKALFETTKRGTKLERRQSVAVMERTKRTPKKMNKSKLLTKSPARNWMSPRRRMVAETPCHRQMSTSMFQPASSQPDQEPDDLDSTHVVQESPEKSYQPSLKDTPTKGKRAKALLRRSFYSAGLPKRTKNMTHYSQLADRIAGRQRHPSNPADKPKKLLSFDADPLFKSPDKNSSFLLSQLVSSPSPAKTTPRKSTRTPSKLVADSPGLHTRSLAGLSRLNLMSPEFPVGRSMPRPSSSHLLSPVSRRQSPRIFVPESDTKSPSIQSHTTPEKSPVVGTVSFGLDSPSHNTRQKTAATPTRKSVRAALFAKSPAARKHQSPARAVASPTTLVSRFLSPSKSRSGEKACRMSPRRILDTQISIGFSPAKVGKENKNISLENSSIARTGVRNLHLSSINREEKVPFTPADNSVISSPVGKGKNLPPNHSSSQKTPSPHRKKTTKTPDSFDKWHRRKPRSTQASPAPNKRQPTNIEMTESSKVGQSVPIIKSVGDMNLSRLSVLNSPGRRKRSLMLSPEKPVESPSKRRRTGRLDTTVGSDRFQSQGSFRGSQGFDVLSSPGRGKRSLIMSPEKTAASPGKGSSCIKSLTAPERGSQGFDATGSFNLSQASCSSVDYFSVTNDEVFLSQDEPSSADSSSQHSHKSKSDKFRLIKKHSTSDSISSVLSPSKRYLPRLISEEASGSERSESPIFGATKSTVRTRHVSGCKDSVLMDIDNSINSSPTTRRSPALRKFSPGVSAKSLMHLIQSPLLASPAGETKDSNASPSNGNVKSRNRDRTRRSLKLQN